DSDEAITELAEAVARRFALDFAAICLPRAEEWDIHRAGSLNAAFNDSQLITALGVDDPSLGNDVRQNRTTILNDHHIQVAPLRLEPKAAVLFAPSGRSVEPATLDALAGVAAIAVERAQFLEARKAADLARRSEELKAALLSSIAHNLRTPLTAIRIAASNQHASWLTDSDRREQSELILAEVERLNPLFQNTLELTLMER